MELGDQGGYMRDPQALFLWTACLHAITLHLLCERMLRGLFEPPGNLPGPNTQPLALPHHYMAAYWKRNHALVVETSKHNVPSNSPD